MSLRTLAQKHLSELSSFGLSRRDTPKGCPSGTNFSLAMVGRTGETIRTAGTGGTAGTRYLKALQYEADNRNRQPAPAHITDRWCGCKLATLAVGRFRSSKSNSEGVARWFCCDCFTNKQKSLNEFYN